MLNKIDSMQAMVDVINNARHVPHNRVSKESYKEFQRHWLFLALGGKRYGQAFCEYFKIPTGTPLYFFRDNKLCEQWIEDNYIE